jgi:tetratricopeptide (TPR) repeat protein
MSESDTPEGQYRARLAEWPWAIGPLYEAPHADLIERHAEGHLSRALAIGRVTAFIGSGASAAYGRIGWLELIDAVSDFYLDEYDRHSKALSGNLLAARIYVLLKKHHRSGTDSKAVDQLARYQLAADLSREMAPFRKAGDDFAARLAWMVRDAGGHVRWLFEQLGTHSALDNTSALESESLPSAWDTETKKTVTDIIDSSIGFSQLEPALRPVPADYTPARLHRVVAALVMLPDDERAQALDALLPPKGTTSGTVPYDPRASRISGDRDPLKIVLSEFKINRFLTTNYDHEIENLFHEAGYKASVPTGRGPAGLPSTPARAVWRDLVFTYDTSGELGALVSRDRSSEAWVVHLHGRAERGGPAHHSSAIIATEDDYRARYERLDKSRSVIDDTIRLTFGSSPLLFLGIGFDEIDLLRPLRQFMSAPGRMGDRLAVALLPRHSDEPSAELRKIDLLQRFGVYTIHYGGEWLFRVQAISRALSAALDARRRALGEEQIKDARAALTHEVNTPSPPFDFREDPQQVEADDHLWRDLRDLRHAVDAALTDGPLDERQILAHSIRARGAVTSITTAALCRKLRELQDVRDRWIRDWYTIPAPKAIDQHPDQLPLRRHLPVLVPALDVAWPDSFYSGAASQTFNALTSALRKAPTLAKPTPGQLNVGTRAFLFVAPRGLGKGHFFSALVSDARRKDFQELIGSRPYVQPAAFVNLSFSIEIASVFDRLAEYLWHHAPESGLPTDDDKKAWTSLAKDRIKRLELALRVWRQKKSPDTGRVLVAFNNVNMLFDRHGRPKNRQIRELFHVLVPDGDLRTGAPIDLVLVASGAAAPNFFGGGANGGGDPAPARSRRPTLLEREDISARGKQGARRMLEECGIRTEGDDEDPNRFVHVLHYARTSIVCTAFFPSVALLIAADAARNTTDPLPPLPGDPQGQAKSIRDLFTQDQGVWILRDPKKAFPLLLLAAIRRRNGLAGLLSGPDGGIHRGALCADRAEFAAWLGQGDPSLDTGDDAIKPIDDAFRYIYHACGDSRFALTLLFSAMNEPLASPDAEDAAKRQAMGEKVLRFKAAVCSQANRIPPVRRTDFIIRNVLEEMRDRHEAGAPLSHEASINLQRALGSSSPPPAPGLAMFDLQEAILWHLSVASIPLEVEVLCGCPLVRASARDALTQLDPAKENDDPAPIVQFAALLLVSRCLAFRLEATPPSKKAKDGSPDYRYSVHRMVQRHFLRRTGAGFIEYPDIDEFSLTLYANQPNDTPYLTVEGHEQLRRTVSALAVHPEGIDAGKREDEWPKSKDLQARRLRAAYSIVRSIYSVSAVSHFDIKHRRLDLPAHPAGTLMSPGFFEEHRRQILWLLHQARKFEDQPGAPAPFYAEDIVWLYNEAGVLSLAEGHLPESQSLLESADKAAEKIEPHELGPLRLLIRLNQAAAQIDRGRLQHADELLKHIVTQLKNEPDEAEGELLTIAEGYRAIVAHLKGYYEEAQKLYKRVSLKLATKRKSRAASLFARSHANLLLRNGDWHGARERIQVALQLATDDSHEDMRHLALLTQARRSVAGLNDPRMSDGETSRTIHANLNGIEQYARMMGMRKLASEVDEVRARLYLKNGDLQAAGTSAMNSLEVASLNELGIQKGAVLLLLADINLQRDHFSACRAYLEEAERVARETDYHIGTIDAQQIRDRLRAQDLTETRP